MLIYLGDYLKDLILEVLAKFIIEPYQLFTVTSDNGANMLHAINLLEEETSLITDNNVNDKIVEIYDIENRKSSENSPDNSDDETR